MRHYLARGREGREATGEWKGREAAMESRTGAGTGHVGFIRLCRALIGGAVEPDKGPWPSPSLILSMLRLII